MNWTPSPGRAVPSPWPRRLLRWPAFCRGSTPRRISFAGSAAREFGRRHRGFAALRGAQRSGLGTSSILAATVLAALSDLCGLGWDRNTLFSRTLALEQMLTTGGGWQDQAGAIFRGLKFIETVPGLSQKPTLRWLPDHLFSRD